MKKIEIAISNWDPMNLLDISPDDEYSVEVKEIEEKIHEDIDAEELTEIIYNIFVNNFGETFKLSKLDCMKVAIEILA